MEYEKDVLEYWRKNKSFESSCELSKNRKKFTFYDGPPFATGLPHYGHILSGTIKDTMTRFYYQQGYRVDRRFGWDCHGLPVEHEIDKSLGIINRKQVLEMGIDKYNNECRNIVMRYSEEWEKVVERMGRWVDFKNGYRTMDVNFMESVWYVFKKLFDEGYVYRGFKVMPFSTACLTPLSNFEASENYKTVRDPSVLVTFPLTEHFLGRKVNLVAWTTTPWTLPSNCGVVVKSDFVYVIFKHNGCFYAVHENKVDEYFKDVEVLEKVSGDMFVGLEYEPLFPYFEIYKEKGFFRVIASEFVTSIDGTGIVHCAPGFGEEDYKAFIENGLIRENELVPCPVDENGRYTGEVKDYAGRYVRDCNEDIIESIKHRILMSGKIEHKYPFCWRSDTPLLYKLVQNWFIKVKDHVEPLLENNERINWVPGDIKHGKFYNWLKCAKDWSISRDRFWGTPIPLWVTENYSDIICICSIAELEKLSGRNNITDIHREFVDDIVIQKDGKEYRRIDEVFDCWFESGCMPYAQDHWPFSATETPVFDKNIAFKKDGFPADFISEGSDQTRGWFYVLHVISLYIAKSPAFLNAIVNGIVLAANGKKMSKRLKNYPDPARMFEEYGADSLRMYLISSPVVKAENLRFNEEGVKNVLKTLIMPWYNSLRFYFESMNSRESIDKELSLDSWIRASLNKFISSVTRTMKNYDLSPVLCAALRFIDCLSNWYIRIHRKEIRAGNRTVLYEVLRDFSVAMGPFTPFFSEYSYQTLSPGESVHFQMYPAHADVEAHPFDSVKDVITAIRHVREKNLIPLKTPLKSTTIHGYAELCDNVKKYSEIIKWECNAIHLIYRDEDQSSVVFIAKPNFETLKKKPGMKEKMEIISKLSRDQVTKLQASSLSVDGVEILKEDVLIEKKIRSESKTSMAFEGFCITIDNTLDENIIEMKTAREFHSYVQKLRKDVGLDINDCVTVWTENQKLKDIVSKHFEMVFERGKVSCGKGSYVFDGDVYPVFLYKKSFPVE